MVFYHSNKKVKHTLKNYLKTLLSILSELANNNYFHNRDNNENSRAGNAEGSPITKGVNEITAQNQSTSKNFAH